MFRGSGVGFLALGWTVCDLAGKIWSFGVEAGCKTSGVEGCGFVLTSFRDPKP